MCSKRTKPDELPTIWRVPEVLWRKIKPLLDEFDPPNRTGRKRRQSDGMGSGGSSPLRAPYSPDWRGETDCQRREALSRLVERTLAC